MSMLNRLSVLDPGPDEETPNGESGPTTAQTLDWLSESWDETAALTPPPPPLDWEDLKDVLLDGVTEPKLEVVLQSALLALMKQARFKPAHRVIDEIVVLLTTGRDPAFAAKVCSGEAPMH